MLVPAQVIPFLRHDDEAVRTHAADYLADAHDPSPATAEDLWAAIDQIGLNRSTWLLSLLRRLPQTDASLDRLLQSLRSGGLAEDADYHLQLALLHVDLPLLSRRKDELLSADGVLPRVRDHLAQRLELAGRPADELWDALAQHSRDADDMAVGEFDPDVSGRLIEALARHGEAVGGRALGRLRDGPVDDWMEIFCIRLVGKLRYAPATQALVDRFLIDADLLREDVARALTRIGAPEVVERIEAFYPGKPWHVRLYAHGPLGRIKRPESEQALLRLLADELDDEQRTWLAMSLCDLCSRDALDVVCRMVVKHRYDPQIVELDEMLLAVATMTGYAFREAAEVRDRVERRRRKREELAALPESDRFLRLLRERWRAGQPQFPRGAGDDPPDGGAYGTPPGAETDWPSDDGPVRRDAAKVGRNDPCPCGSGKKYKKCCLNAART